MHPVCRDYLLLYSYFFSFSHLREVEFVLMTLKYRIVSIGVYFVSVLDNYGCKPSDRAGFAFIYI